MALSIQDLLETTAGARSEMIHQREEASRKLEEEISGFQKESRKLTEENADKIAVRDVVSRKIRVRKSGGNWLVFLAIVAAACAFFLLKEEAQKTLQILGYIGAGALFVLGIVVRTSHRKYRKEMQEADYALCDYDINQKEFASQIEKREVTVKKNKIEIETIRDFEKDETFYRFQDSVSSGHVVLVVTSEFHAFADDPKEPKEGKEYDSYQIKEVQICVDGAPCATVEKKRFRSQTCWIGHVELPAAARQIDFRIAYGIADTGIHQEMIGPMSVPEDASLFGWAHVSMCGKYTSVFKRSYNSLDELRSAVAISRSEITKL